MMSIRSCCPALFLVLITTAGAAAPVTLTVALDQPGKAISPDLIGVFFEDINYAADGGLYAELVQNRSFDYSPVSQATWNALTSWEIVRRGEGARGSLAVASAEPLHPNNPSYAVLHVDQPGDGVGVSNAGFGGITVTAGEAYDFAVFARQQYVDERWGPAPLGVRPERTILASLLVRLETAGGDLLAEARLAAPTWDWSRLTATLTPARTEADARLVVLVTARGGVSLDVVSLFPRKTFRDRPNGLRPDLAQVIADLRPRFIRFPGGCVAHGDGLNNMYRWKDTIGPIEQRRTQPNLWRYHQSMGLGYFEYFQFCADIGAAPLPVVPAGVCCQNSNHQGGTGQRGLPLDQMDDYVQEVLDLIEYANGPADSPWGAKRAAAGHPAPFGLKYLGVGNEDVITPVFRERFQLIADAVRARHPEILVIGTAGPFPDGEDFEAGWQFSRTLGLPLVDEHYYRSPEWFLQNLHRYDTYDRAGPRVYAGEYAAHDTGRRSTLRSALAEAAFLTGLERNGDLVHLASYAPLLAKVGSTQWRPDLIYFTNTTVHPTINYHVQQLFSLHAGDRYLPATLADPGAAPAGEPATFAASVVRDSASGDVIVKLVNPTATAKPVSLAFAGAALPATATCIVLAGPPDAENTAESATPVLPVTTQLPLAATTPYEAPPHSLTVLRFASRRP